MIAEQPSVDSPTQFPHDVQPGAPLPFGATAIPNGVNFSLYSNAATACTLVLYRKGEAEPYAELPIPDHYRIGDVFAVRVIGVDYHEIGYGYRLAGPFDPKRGYRFDPAQILVDPYAGVVGGRTNWGEIAEDGKPYTFRGHIPDHEAFQWDDDHPLGHAIEDLVIYEMHVRGLTRHESSGVNSPGTYDGVREKIPYLKALGVNCVELLPVYEFDEFSESAMDPDTGELLLNYWGYNPVSFFAPKAGFAASKEPGAEVNELKALIKDLHDNGIEVILDVVYNHTGEGNEKGPTISYKGIDNQIYYILTPEGSYVNASGTGNTFNCNHPRVRNLIIDSLRYWVAEYHIDGFRFDLASILTREMDGTPIDDPPIVREIVACPVLSRTKLIAEPWDADGLYHLGRFPSHDRWSEWNGEYRDTLRRFLKGDAGQTPNMARVLQGSPHLYPGRGPVASINFITAHDGFTLMDLVSYNEKHNEANHDEDSGSNDNLSWNCGHEGPTDDPAVNALRRRQIMNAVAMLMVSRGVPMILMGDEIGRTQNGNNNTFRQDNELSWMDWRQYEWNADLFQFFQTCIAFRHAHPVLRGWAFPRGEDDEQKGFPDLSWHGVSAGQPDWSDGSRTLAFLLNGDYAKSMTASDDHIYVAMNMDWREQSFEIPAVPDAEWHLFAYTGNAETPCSPLGQEPRLDNQHQFTLTSRSVLILLGKHPK
jgi:isoamylase